MLQNRGNQSYNKENDKPTCIQFQPSVIIIIMMMIIKVIITIIKIITTTDAVTVAWTYMQQKETKT